MFHPFFTRKECFIRLMLNKELSSWQFLLLNGSDVEDETLHDYHSYKIYKERTLVPQKHPVSLTTFLSILSLKLKKLKHRETDYFDIDTLSIILLWQNLIILKLYGRFILRICYGSYSKQI